MQSINIKRAKVLEEERIEAIEKKTGTRIIEIMDTDRQRNTLAAGLYLNWQVTKKLCEHLGIQLTDLGIAPELIAQAEQMIADWEQIKDIREAGKQAENDGIKVEDYIP